MSRFRLIPRDERFFHLFEQAAGHAITGADALVQLLDDIDNAELYRRKIADLEHAADGVFHEAMDTLNRTFVTPLDGEDIRTIANRLDDILDFTQAAAERVVLYHVTTTHPGAVQLAEVLRQATREVQRVVALFRDLSKRREILTGCIEINRLENDGDHLYRKALSQLFHDGDLMELLRWKEIFEKIEMAIDTCEDLADAIEMVVAKHA